MTESALVSEIMVAASDRGHRLEIDIETDVITAASAAGHRLFKNKVGARRKGKSYVKLGIGGDGAPDLWGWNREGYAVLIEMKKPGEKPKKHQNDWRKAALLSCPTLRIGWADSVEGALEILEGKNAPHPMRP